MSVAMNFLVQISKVAGAEEQNSEDMCVHGRTLIKLISDTLIFRT